jgi:hypothetical protein
MLKGKTRLNTILQLYKVMTTPAWLFGHKTYIKIQRPSPGYKPTT